jgi:hypothetical protein
MPDRCSGNLEDPRVVEAMRLMRESLHLLDLAGFGAKAFAYHLSFAIESAAEAIEAPKAEPLRFHGMLETDGESFH